MNDETQDKAARAAFGEVSGDTKQRVQEAVDAFYAVVKSPRRSRLRMRRAVRMLMDHMDDADDIRTACHLLNMFDAINGPETER